MWFKKRKLAIKHLLVCEHGALMTYGVNSGTQKVYSNCADCGPEITNYKTIEIKVKTNE